MKQAMINLPIFPLPVFLLPGGVTKLRIFEPRYLKMVSIASANQGFVIYLSDKILSESMLDNPLDNSLDTSDKSDLQKNLQWGSWVNIINFDQGDDGILEIDVECSSLVKINTLTQDKDKLHFGNVCQLEHWSQQHTDKASGALSSSLGSVFADNAILSNLYPQKLLNDTNWVLARWLEILPIELKVKSDFIDNFNFVEAKDFVESIIFK